MDGGGYWIKPPERGTYMSVYTEDVNYFADFE